MRGKFEYLAFEQAGFLYGLPITQIDMMEKAGTDATETIEKWLGTTITDFPTGRVIRSKHGQRTLFISGIQGIFECFKQDIWPLPALIASHRKNNLLWGVCRFANDADRLVLLLDLEQLEGAA